MSTHDLEKSGWAPRPVADRLLVLLKTRGPQTAADLGQALGTTGENARQQLSKLAGDGLVAAHAEARGVGRPSQVWQLTDTGQERFPDTHAELTLQLLRSVRETFGAYALDRLIDIRSREGYMAEWRVDDDGSLLLVENHCPICAAAATCQGFCRSELEVFQEVLGPSVAIERVEHILAGARRCAYRIREKDMAA